MTTLTLSAAPRITKAMSEIGKLVESEKMTVANPNTMTAENILMPTYRFIGMRTSKTDIASAPAAGAERRNPSPQGPVWSRSRAKIGSSAVTPPSKTANRSREMAPRTIGRLRMNKTPEKIDRNEIGSRLGGVRSMRITNMALQAADKQRAETPRGTVAPVAKSNPPSDGPTMVAVCIAEEETATAFGRRVSGTRPGNNADMVGVSKARAA